MLTVFMMTDPGAFGGREAPDRIVWCAMRVMGEFAYEVTPITVAPCPFAISAGYNDTEFEPLWLMTKHTSRLVMVFAVIICRWGSSGASHTIPAARNRNWNSCAIPTDPPEAMTTIRSAWASASALS